MSRPQPMVIWQGRLDFGKEVFRVVNRGIPRDDKNDQQFMIEQAHGRDAMYEKSWGGVSDHSKTACIKTIGDCFGRVLIARPESLLPGHMIGCELNMAQIEGRETKGCDCELGPDPSRGKADDRE